MERQPTSVSSIVDLVLKAVALSMAVCSIVLSFLNSASADVQITLLGIGLFALALAALQKTDVE
jgi:hypothetical protein